MVGTAGCYLGKAAGMDGRGQAGAKLVQDGLNKTRLWV